MTYFCFIKVLCAMHEKISHVLCIGIIFDQSRPHLNIYILHSLFLFIL